MLTYVLAQCDMPQLDLEIQYMMELLDPSLLHGEGKRLWPPQPAMTLPRKYEWRPRVFARRMTLLFSAFTAEVLVVVDRVPHSCGSTAALPCFFSPFSHLAAILFQASTVT